MTAKRLQWVFAFVTALGGAAILLAQNPVSVAQLGTTAVDTNSGTKSAGTLRVVLATDQPALTNALKVDGSGVTQPVSGTFWQATQPVSIADGSDTTLGAKADAKSTATDTTAISIMQVLKEISAMEQAPASRAVTNAGTFATQATLQAGTAYAGKVATWADGTLASGVTTAMTGTTSTSVIAGTASNYVYVGSCSINNTHASVDTLVNLQDGSGGTTIWTFVALHGYSGESHTFTPPLKVPTSGNGLFAADATTGASVIVSCQGFKSTTSF